MGLEEQKPLPAVDRFRAMYGEALPVVYRFVSRRVGGDRALAEDLPAEAFAAAVAEFRAGRPDVVTTSWLCTVAKRRLIDHWRRQRVAAGNVTELAGRGPSSEGPDTAERELIVRALGALSVDERSALVLQHVEGFSVDEVAGIIGRTSKAVESLLSRARRAFRVAYSEASDG